MYKFEDFLREQHMSQYRGSDDDAPYDFETWVSMLCTAEWVEYGDKYAEIIRLSEPH